LDTISKLTLSLCAVSVVSTLLFCILPEHNGYRKAFKAVSSVMCAAIIFNSVLSLINIDYKDNKVALKGENQTIIEDYIIQKNTEAYLMDVANETKQTFNKYNVKCSKIFADSVSSKLVFYVNKNAAGLEKELNKLTNVKCLVMVGEYDE